MPTSSGILPRPRCTPLLNPRIMTVYGVADHCGYHRVGGIISETSYKFFVQLMAYGTLFCVFTLVVMAYFVAEARSLVSLCRPLPLNLSHGGRNYLKRLSSIEGSEEAIYYLQIFCRPSNCKFVDSDVMYLWCGLGVLPAFLEASATYLCDRLAL